MPPQIPTSMQAIAIAKYGKPDTYDVATLPVPKISKPDEILIKVHASSINPIDVKTLSGMTKVMKKDKFPLKLGLDAAGIVVAVGDGVTVFKVGDEVYTRVPGDYQGTTAEFVLSLESAVASKPSNISFTQAAGVPLAGLTAYQCLKRADERLPGGLKGKTVFVTAGLGGTGHFAAQLAKNVFEAGKVITTVSTRKITQAQELLGDSPVVQLVDYTKEDVVTAVGRGTVDYMFDTTGATMSYSPVMKKGGVIISISTMPSGDQMVERGMKDMPFAIRYLLNFINWFYTSWMGLSGIQYEYIFMSPSRVDLEAMAQWIEQGKLIPIIGRTSKFSDVEAVRHGCLEIYEGKGGTGKFVVEVVPS